MGFILFKKIILKRLVVKLLFGFWVLVMLMN